jgi:uncharacterized membrane protein YgaE (UPF0421/DUF939 family)
MLTVLALAIVAGVGIYNMIGSRRAYSWILGTVTALMVLRAADQVSSLSQLALDRVIDVAIGVGSTLLVALAARRREDMDAAKTTRC